MKVKLISSIRNNHDFLKVFIKIIVIQILNFQKSKKGKENNLITKVKIQGI